ncbi:DegQ family serine endoprotease [Azospirillum sp. Vi22]|uniref:DegQ family serine endoprotease n=1 Tax=Azospirillum baldaniorum TaxID=1064539 RepID=UPI00157A2828|nr:DegQ family serine endoprotease [Azospirillum baldaniorum]NUB07274.1 DegQ family serine endoprotease [Azospirillum baldaniorum]
MSSAYTMPSRSSARAAALAPPAHVHAVGLALSACLLLSHPAVAQQREVPPTFAELATAKLPTVVTIIASSGAPPVRQMAQSEQPDIGPGMGPFSTLPDSPLRDFLEDLIRRQAPHRGEGPDAAPRGRPARALGSGFVIDPTGYVVTNNHVVENADKVEVTLSDKQTLPAKIVGTDQKTDLALLKVDPKQPLPSVQWGDSDRSRIGDWVLAIGNPFGLGGTVTAGIISARGRDIGAGPYDDFLQTDAAINQGNSGGPMFSLQGEVIGVNTAIFSQSGGNVGIGFAIPSDLAKPVIAALRDKGRVTRGYLGVMIQPVEQDVADALGLKDRSGALVADVTKDSPAAQAGIQPGDVITEYAGKSVSEPHALTGMVAQTKPGDTVPIAVLRDGRVNPLNVHVLELQPTRQAEAQPQNPGEGKLGLALAPVTPELRKEFGLDPDAQGAVVVDVAPNSPAARVGLQPGDVITRVGPAPVTGPADVAKAVEEARKAKKDHVLVQRRREDGALFVPLPVGS